MEANNSSESQHGSDNNSHKDDNGSSNERNGSVNKAAPPLAVPWMAMPYPAMVMQHGMMPPPLHYPQYMPYHHLLPPPPLSPSPKILSNGGGPKYQSKINGGSNEENKTIWVGDLRNWMDEDYLGSCFASTGEVKNIKVIRNKHTQFSEGYGFVEFITHAAADNALQSYSDAPMPHCDQLFRLNWATFSTGEKRSNNASDMSIFVGDLAADVTDSTLQETFFSRYPSVKSAKVVVDANTGRSKGYGFVRFGEDSEKLRAMTEMNGIFCSTRPMRIGAATPRKSSTYQQQYSPPGGYSNGVPAQSDGEAVNTTIFVGGLDPSVSDEDLRQPFSQHGEIVSVKIPVGKGCGFVQFANRHEAESALEELNGTTIGKQTVRLSWGRNPGNKSRGGDYRNQWPSPGPYYVDGYGYPMPLPHDPVMYPPPYGVYPVYRSPHQQQVN